LERGAGGVRCGRKAALTVVLHGSFSLRETSGNVRVVDIVYEHQDIICAKRDPVFFLWWRRTPTLPQATVAFEHLQAAAKSVPGGVVIVVIMGEEVGQPDRATGDFLTRSMRPIEKYVLAHAFILEGTGLKASALRTAFRAMQTMSRAIFPSTVSQTVEESMLFLAKKTGFITEPEAREMIDQLAQIRSTRPAHKQA
jgi:hypothetical protein